MATAGGLVLSACSTTRRRPALSTDPIWSDAERRSTYEPLPKPAVPAEPIPSHDFTASPRVMPRAAWTREDPKLYLANPMGAITRITVHHDGMPPVELRSQADVAARIDLIRRSHLQRGWADIGYHYVVDPQGRVWQGRPRNLQGAHVKNNNENNLGVLVLGNFMEQYPTPAATGALDAFVIANMRLFRVPDARVYTHQEINPTACPGTHLQAHMVKARGRGGAIAAAF